MSWHINVTSYLPLVEIFVTPTVFKVRSYLVDSTQGINPHHYKYILWSPSIRFKILFRPNQHALDTIIFKSTFALNVFADTRRCPQIPGIFSSHPVQHSWHRDDPIRKTLVVTALSDLTGLLQTGGWRTAIISCKVSLDACNMHKCPRWHVTIYWECSWGVWTCESHMRATGRLATARHQKLRLNSSYT